MPVYQPGGLFLWPFSVKLPRLGVTQHRALWSLDFPHPRRARSATAWPTWSNLILIYYILPSPCQAIVPRGSDINWDIVFSPVWVVGYGLDYADLFRTLPYIAALKREVYER